MRLRALVLPAFALALALPARAQVFAGTFNAKQDGWELRLKQGDAAAVRQEVESFLASQSAGISPTDYGDQHALVGARGLDARACVAMGDWEAGLDCLQKAAATADQNLSTTEAAFAKLRADHADKLKLWRGELTDAQGRLDQLNAAAGLTEDQMKLKGQLQTFVAEHQSSIQHSEDSLKAMDSALATLRQEKDAYGQSASSWQSFIAKEKDDISALGGVDAYVSEKAAQVKADTSKGTEERLAYARRLVRLAPANADAKRLLDGLQGKPSAAEARPAKRRKRR